MIGLDELLSGTPSWSDVVDFWKEDDFCDESYLIEAIKKHLQTEDQRNELFKRRLTIEKMLNGSYVPVGDDSAFVQSVFDEWNGKLGFKAFGF